MIRACTAPFVFVNEPQRALDLLTEMTIDHKIPPTADTYNAVIMACAKSGSTVYVNEAFRLTREMFDSHRDAYSRPKFSPGNKTLYALLEGAKRVRDLARTRWILAEMVKWSSDNPSQTANTGEGGLRVDENTMMHVFHAYASYKPPFRRAAAVLKDDLKSPTESSLGESEVSKETSTDHILAVEKQPAFLHIPPQSRPEILAEAKALFTRILEDTGENGHQTQENSTIFAHKAFENVKLTPRLLNSYLSIYYSHSSLAVSEKLFRSIFEDLSVPRNARSYVEALERCTLSPKGHSRTAAFAFAKYLWAAWEEREVGGPNTSPFDHFNLPRLIERAHIAMIKMCTLTGDLERAVNRVKTFFDRYPPEAIRQAPPKSSLRSTRTVLAAQRPIVRIASPTQVPDDKVPPLLTFTDLEILHHRLVEARERDRIGYLTFVCKAYEGALRMRRELTMRSDPRVDDM